MSFNNRYDKLYEQTYYNEHNRLSADQSLSFAERMRHGHNFAMEVVRQQEKKDIEAAKKAREAAGV